MYRSNLVDYSLYGPTAPDTDNSEVEYYPLDPNNVALSSNAKSTLNEATEKISEHLHLSTKRLTETLKRSYFSMEPSGFLVILMEVEELEAEMFIEIPPDYWWLKKEYQA